MKFRNGGRQNINDVNDDDNLCASIRVCVLEMMTMPEYIIYVYMIYLFLKSLTQLDLSHNYLRAVTSDLVDGLPSLESLDLTDNDISLVEPGALTNLPKLIHLSLTGKRLFFSFIHIFRNLFSYIYIRRGRSYWKSVFVTGIFIWLMSIIFNKFFFV